MEVFIDVISRDGTYYPARVPTRITAGVGVGKVVPFSCRLAQERGLPLGVRMAVFHLEQMHYVPWPSFAESSVRDHDTLVVVACDDPALDDPHAIEGLWLAHDGAERRSFHAAEAHLRRFERVRDSRRAS